MQFFLKIDQQLIYEQQVTLAYCMSHIFGFLNFQLYQSPDLVTQTRQHKYDNFHQDV